VPKEYHLSGYDPLKHQGEVDVVVKISGVPPEFPYGTYEDGKDAVDKHDEWYEEQAKLATEAIISNLPQGVVHRILILLLEQYASHYRGKTGT